MLYRFVLLILFCSFSGISPAQTLTESSPFGIGERLSKRFPPPDGFTRVPVRSNSFAAFLRSLPVKPVASPVLDYKNRIVKDGADTTVAAVVQLNIKGKKLEQCMDILQRLFAEYCIQSGQEKKIGFLLPDKTKFFWHEWREGWRPVRAKDKYPLQKIGHQARSRDTFEDYLKEIFYHSGTQTNYFGLKKIAPAHVSIGDMLIKRGPRGHAVLITDMVENSEGIRMALFAQGDTPACQLHILQNTSGMPWIPLDVSQPSPELPIRKKMHWNGLRRF
ncbi:MAG: hypothetical protein DWQ10_17615 [Calditrichaeota bacterium]|nr:MAG: hypothetical protein DWQ10_17615 [Calditrichota bacterium]